MKSPLCIHVSKYAAVLGNSLNNHLHSLTQEEKMEGLCRISLNCCDG